MDQEMSQADPHACQVTERSSAISIRRRRTSNFRYDGARRKVARPFACRAYAPYKLR